VRTLARARDAEEIRRRLRNLRADTRRSWGEMSAHQMVCHLNDSFLVMTGERPAKPMGGSLAGLQRTIVKWIALWVPLRWPRRIRTAPEVDQMAGGTLPSEFAADLARLEGLIDLVTTRRFDDAAHPIFGRMSSAAWLRWGYLHADHHLRQFGL
jgi:hypothetical protein